MKTVYFAGSIRGGRDDVELYGRIIRYIQQKNIVLTEHIASPDLYATEKDKSDEEIYDEDMSWLRESDLVIAECTHPSLGVGYELGFAEAHSKLCYIFYDKNRAYLSAMLTGNPYFKVYGYQSESEIYPIVDRILEG